MEHCAYIFLSEGGDKSVNEGEGTSTFLDGGQALMAGNYPLMGGGSHNPLHIGQPCFNSFLDSQSFPNCHQSMGSEGMGVLGVSQLEKYFIYFLHVSEHIDHS